MTNRRIRNYSISFSRASQLGRIEVTFSLRSRMIPGFMEDIDGRAESSFNHRMLFFDAKTNCSRFSNDVVTHIKMMSRGRYLFAAQGCGDARAIDLFGKPVGGNR